MGCDIHGMFEYKHPDYSWWVNAGDPDVGRDYTLFAVIANVRNYNEAPFIGSKRIKITSENGEDEPEDWHFSDAFRALCRAWSGHGHSHSYVTLAEIKAFDTSQRVYDHRLILERGESGEIKSVCASTNGSHMGEVGETTVFGVFGDHTWRRLIAFGDDIARRNNRSDDEVRWVFFFDN